jgi:SagB-type dehydrogenase family enzyme
LCLLDPVNGTRSTIPLGLLDFLTFFEQPRTVDDLVRSVPGLARQRADELVRRLLDLSLIGQVDVDAGGRPDPTEGWDPPAALFHFWSKFTRHARGAERERLERALSRRSARVTPPNPVKRHSGAAVVPLPRAAPRGEFARVLLSRRTWRGFSRAPVPLDALASLLHLTFGVQRWGQAGATDRVAFKTSPSAGARHPIEAYVLALRVNGLARGVYHYAADAGVLERLVAGATTRDIDRLLCGQHWYRPAAAVVFMTAVMPRAWWRYPVARSYRCVLLDAGHLCQTFCLVATWLGLAPFCTAALDDPAVERRLGIDGSQEVVLYAAGVGARPADGQHVQWPAVRNRVRRR